MVGNSASIRTRIVVLSVLCGVVALVFIGRLFKLQVRDSDKYREQADGQYVVPTGSSFNRGSIYFTKRDGQLVTAATVMTGYKVAITPRLLTDVEGTYTQISAIIPIEKEEFMKKADRISDPYEEIATRATKEQSDALNKLEIPGLVISPEKWRFYPGENLASKALGFVSFKGDDLIGRYGLERHYNDVLSRQSKNLYSNFFAEVFSNINDSFFGEESTREGDLVTTLEPVVEGSFERTLADALDAWDADAVGGIIMDPKTGEIMAMVHLPDFNLNNFSKEKSVSIYNNPNVENVYELGSVIKPLVMARGIEAGVVSADTSYTDNGFVMIEGKRLNNFDRKGRGPGTTMQDVLNQSLNTGMVLVMEKLGKEKFRDGMLAYGLGEKTGVDLPGEVDGLVRNLQSTRTLEYATSSFGQGIAITPIAAMRAFSSLANGGYLVTPHLVKEIKYEDGSSRAITYPIAGAEENRVLTQEASEEITRMLVTVVDKALGDGVHTMKHHSIAAKTGTAQVAREDGGGYYEDRNMHSVFGYMPAYDPRFLVYIYAINPKNGARFASQTLADPFFDIISFLVSYYTVPPDR